MLKQKTWYFFFTTKAKNVSSIRLWRDTKKKSIKIGIAVQVGNKYFIFVQQTCSGECSSYCLQ